MGKVIVDMTMSLDGFITGPNDGPNNGLGDGGRILHDWVFDGRTEADNQFLEGGNLASCVLGRRTFDIAESAWGDHPPFGPATVFIPTHRPHETIKRGPTTFVFVPEGVERALEMAKAEAGDMDVNLMGADVSQQLLKAGLVDEMQLHIANVLLTAGRPLFTNIGADQIKLERISVVPTPSVTHIRYRIVK